GWAGGCARSAGRARGSLGADSGEGAVREPVEDAPAAVASPPGNGGAPAVVEIPRGDTAALSRATGDGFDDERVFSGVWRPWDTYEKGELGDRVRDTHDLLRNSHLIAPSHLTIVCLAAL